MATTSQPSVLTSSKGAQARFLFRTVVDGFFYNGQVNPDQVAALVAVCKDPGTELMTLVELHVKWVTFGAHRITAVHPLEKDLEQTLKAAIVRYAATL